MKQSAVEYLVEKILIQQEMYIDKEGEWIDIPKIEYVNGYKSHVDLSEFVQQAKEMENEMLFQCWKASEQNMRSQFSSSAYKNVMFEEWFGQAKEMEKQQGYSEEEVLGFGKFCVDKIADFLDGKGDQTDGIEYSMEELFEQFKKK